MTLIVGKVCNDGVILGSDSKAYDNLNPPTYDNKKVFEVGGNKAIAFTGKNILGKITASAIAGSAMTILRHKNISLEELVNRLTVIVRSHIYADDTRIGLIVADPNELYTLVASYSGCEIEKVIESNAMPVMGINEIKLPSKPRTNTIEHTEIFIRELLDLNVGDFVGGDSQIVILRH